MKCTRFKICSVNQCPLHPLYPDIYTDGNDNEPKCTLQKSYRIKVAENFAGVLKFGSLTSREHAAKIKWGNMTEDERTRIIAQGKKSLLVVHYTNNIESTCVSVAQEV